MVLERQCVFETVTQPQDVFKVICIHFATRWCSCSDLRHSSHAGGSHWRITYIWCEYWLPLAATLQHVLQLLIACHFSSWNDSCYLGVCIIWQHVRLFLNFLFTTCFGAIVTILLPYNNNIRIMFQLGNSRANPCRETSTETINRHVIFPFCLPPMPTKYFRGALEDLSFVLCD